MSGVFSLLYRKWLSKLEYLLIAISILSFIASFSGNNNFTILTPIFLFLSLHANISKHKQSNESRQSQDRVFQLEQLVLSRDANLADIQATLSEIDKLYLEFSQIQQRFILIEDFLKPYRINAQNLNLQQLLNGLEANIKRTERQYTQSKILEMQMILQEQINHVEEQLSENSNYAPAHDDFQDRLLTLDRQIQDLSYQVTNYSDIQAEERIQQSQINEKVQKLERQFNGLPFIEFLNRIAQLEELNEQVKNSLTESKRVTKSLKGEVESVSQKLQCIIATASTAQTENCDRQPSSERQASYEQNVEMTQRLAKEVSSLRKQTQAILSSLSARITQLRIEIDQQQRHSENPATIPPANTDELATWAGEIGDRISK